MPKQGEIDYIKNIPAEAVQQALGKPFSYEMCGRYLMDIGAILSLLPDWPPARILDLGVGTGWTSIFIAKRGFDVVGQDIAADMIALANENKARWGIDNVDFVVSDYEAMTFDHEFDAAVFYDSLHHAVDERLALAKVYQALKPGGKVITVEPGEGHSQSPESIEAMRRWGVTEKDMPPPSYHVYWARDWLPQLQGLRALPRPATHLRWQPAAAAARAHPSRDAQPARGVCRTGRPHAATHPAGPRAPAGATRLQHPHHAQVATLASPTG